MHVFSQSIKFLRNDLFKSLKKMIADIQEDDIHYVLTVPAIWDDSAKQFMREAAVKVKYAFEFYSISLEAKQKVFAFT